MSGRSLLPADVAREALDAVRRAEIALGLPDEPVHLGRRLRSLRDPRGVPGLNLRSVPDPHLHLSHRDTDPVLEARLASRIVVVGKYNRASQVKARAYLAVDGRPATLKVWRMAASESPLGSRERKIRARVGRVPDYRAPEVLAHGRAGGVDYLLESVVQGRHPRGADEIRAAAADLLPSLTRAYATSGHRFRRASRVMPDGFRDRLAGAVAHPVEPWPCTDREREQVGEFLAGLMAADKRMVCALGHGDLVATNIVRRPDDRHVLIDWEHGRVQPIAFDLAKLLVAADADDELVTAAGDAVGPRRRRLRDPYTWPEQLALALARRLIHSPERQGRAAGARRSTQFSAEYRAEVTWLLRIVAAARRS